MEAAEMTVQSSKKYFVKKHHYQTNGVMVGLPTFCFAIPGHLKYRGVKSF